MEQSCQALFLVCLYFSKGSFKAARVIHCEAEYLAITESVPTPVLLVPVLQTTFQPLSRVAEPQTTQKLSRSRNKHYATSLSWERYLLYFKKYIVTLKSLHILNKDNNTI